jgi:hypothetical protein
MYHEDGTNAVVGVKAMLSDKYKITNLGPTRQFLSMDIHHDENAIGISLGQKAFITTILKQLNIQNAHTASTVMDLNVKLDFTEDLGEKEPTDIKG